MQNKPEQTQRPYAERIRQVREAMGLTQNEMSKRLGISRVSLTHYEAGNRTPDVEFLIALHKETGVSLYYLLGLSDCMEDEIVPITLEYGLSEKAVRALEGDETVCAVVEHMLCSPGMASFAHQAAIVHDNAAAAWLADWENWPTGVEKLYHALNNEAYQELNKMVRGVIEPRAPKEKPLGATDGFRPIDFVNDILNPPDASDPKNHIRVELAEALRCWIQEKEAPDAQETPEQ